MSTITYQNTHDTGISVAKGILIILMVIGHSGCPQWLLRFISIFNMPCFFIISGFLLSERHINNSKVSIINKGKRLWLYYVKWTIIFILLHNIFYILYVTPTIYSTQEIFKHITESLILIQCEDLLGGFWFLKDLLISTIFTIIYLKALISWNYNRTAIKYGWVMIVLTLLYPVILYMLGGDAPMKRTSLAIAFYITGVYFRMISNRFILFGSYVIKYISIIIIFITFILSFSFSGAMGTCEGLHHIIYYLISVCVSFGLICLCKVCIFPDKLNVFFDFTGKNTLSILTFHFISFKLISFIKVLIFNLDFTQICEHPVINQHNDIFWIIYTIIGVIFPLLFIYLKKHYVIRLKPSFSYINISRQ